MQWACRTNIDHVYLDQMIHLWSWQKIFTDSYRNPRASTELTSVGWRNEANKTVLNPASPNILNRCLCMCSVWSCRPGEIANWLTIKQLSWEQRLLWGLNHKKDKSKRHNAICSYSGVFFFFFFSFLHTFTPPLLIPKTLGKKHSKVFHLSSYYAPVSALIFHPHCIKYWYWFLVNGGEMDGSHFFVLLFCSTCR